MKIFSLSLVFILFGCNSPLDNKVSEEELNLTKKERLEQDQGLPHENNIYSFVRFDIKAEVQWITGPFSEPVNSSLKVILTDLKGDPVSLDPSSYELGFNAFMPSMGHYLDDPGYFERVGEGVYINPAIKFNMANDWRMDVVIFDLNYKILDVVQWLELL